MGAGDLLGVERLVGGQRLGEMLGLGRGEQLADALAGRAM